jgi:hypothetical protein
MLPPGQGEAIAGLGATLKAPMGLNTSMSSFEVVIAPGYDVGAHVQVIAGWLRKAEVSSRPRVRPSYFHRWDLAGQVSGGEGRSCRRSHDEHG